MAIDSWFSLQELAKELKIWTKLSHPNVLPLLGFALNWNGSAYPSFVSPWMELGTLHRYMRDHYVETLPMVSIDSDSFNSECLH